MEAQLGDRPYLCGDALTLADIALATVMDPTFPQRVKRLVVMGGSNNGRGNITAAGEFNFYVDPHAARTVTKTTA